jgi:hypothetical protein
VLLRVEEAGRGHHRDAGGDPAPVEGDPDGARKILVPGVRDDHAAAGAVPCDATRLCRPQPAGHGPVREVRPASAVEPAERALPAGGHRSQPVDTGRPGRRLHNGIATALCADRSPPSGCTRGRDRADPGQEQDRQGAHLDLCARRLAVRRTCAAGRTLLRLARSPARVSGAAPSRLHRHILQADTYSG